MNGARAALKIALALCVAAFVAYTAVGLAERWRQSPTVQIEAVWLIAAVLPIVGVSLAQAFGWLAVSRSLAARSLPTVPAMELFLASMLGRYAPAKLGMPAILAARAAELELSVRLMASSMLLVVLVYTALGVGTGVSLGLVFGAAPLLSLLPAGVSGLVSGVLVIAGTLAGVGVLLVVDRRRYPAQVTRALGLSEGGPLVPLPLVLWYAAVWLCWWLHGALLILAVGGHASEAWSGAAAFVLAPVLGFLALVAPGGLGVREAVVAAMLGPSLGPANALVAALLSRVVSLAVDVAMWLVFRGLRARGPATKGSAA